MYFINDNLTGGITFFDSGFQVYDGLCLLTECSSESNKVDGDMVRAIAYPNGQYKYTTVGGGSKTIPQFTCNINLVSVPVSTEALKNLKITKPLDR